MHVNRDGLFPVRDQLDQFLLASSAQFRTVPCEEDKAVFRAGCGHRNERFLGWRAADTLLFLRSLRFHLDSRLPGIGLLNGVCQFMRKELPSARGLRCVLSRSEE